MSADDSLPDDVATLKSMLVAERAARMAAEGEAQHRALLIEKLQYTIRKLRHERFGPSSERGTLLDQLELQLADLEEDAAQAETTASAAAQTITVASFARRKPARRPLPEHLPRERIVYPVPEACPCCGDGRLRKIGEDVTETLELVPRQWKVIQHVREKFSCRACEAITQPPAPSHPIARGRAGPKLLAHVLFSKYGLHLPLTRQSGVYGREGIDLDVSTLADWVGASAATLMPLVETIRMHVFAAERLHADDTTVPVLAKVKTRIGRLWTYVRDDRPFGGADPPAAVFFYSPDRAGIHEPSRGGHTQPASSGRQVFCGALQSIPSSKYPSCAGEIVTAPSAVPEARVFDDDVGQIKRPRSNLFENRHAPCPSCQITFSRSPRRPRKTKRWPACGSLLSVSCTSRAKPGKPLRMSVCPVASHTRTPAGTGIIDPPGHRRCA